MVITVDCLKCKRPVDKLATSRDIYRRATTVSIWCHGDYTEQLIGDIASILNDRFQLKAFWEPLPPIIDRDPGDEDVAP